MQRTDGTNGQRRSKKANTGGNLIGNGMSDLLQEGSILLLAGGPKLRKQRERQGQGTVSSHKKGAGAQGQWGQRHCIRLILITISFVMEHLHQLYKLLLLFQERPRNLTPKSFLP